MARSTKPASNTASAGRGKQPRRGGLVAAARGSRPAWPILAAVAVVVVFAGVVLGYVLSRSTQHPGSAQPAGVRTFTGLDRDHVTGPVNYPQNPPVGGPHNPVWQNCGIYTSPVPNENAVHSLEHGAVWITYQPNLPAGEIAQLQASVRGQPYVLLSPYPGLTAPIVASAWGVQLHTTDPADPNLGRFIRAYQQGPQTPEPGAPCTRGTGTPVS